MDRGIMKHETVEQMMRRAWEEGAVAAWKISGEDYPDNPYAPVKMIERFKHSKRCGVWLCECGLGEDWKGTYKEGVLKERARVKKELLLFKEALNSLPTDVAGYKSAAIKDFIEILDSSVVKQAVESHD
jgi:hypothetical protein